MQDPRIAAERILANVDKVIDFKLSPFGRHTFYGVDLKE
mgnify:CR=1 FL=1